MAELSIIYSIPATSSDLEKQDNLTPASIKRCIASARQSALIEQLTAFCEADGGATDA